MSCQAYVGLYPLVGYGPHGSDSAPVYLLICMNSANTVGAPALGPAMFWALSKWNPLHLSFIFSKHFFFYLPACSSEYHLSHL